ALDDLLALVDRHRAIFGRTRSPFQLRNIDVDRNHYTPPLELLCVGAQTTPGLRKALRVGARLAAGRDGKKRALPVMQTFIERYQLAIGAEPLPPTSAGACRSGKEGEQRHNPVPRQNGWAMKVQLSSRGSGRLYAEGIRRSAISRCA